MRYYLDPHREALVLSPLREKKASFGVGLMEAIERQDLIQSFFFYVGSHFIHSWALFGVALGSYDGLALPSGSKGELFS